MTDRKTLNAAHVTETIEGWSPRGTRRRQVRPRPEVENEMDALSMIHTDGACACGYAVCSKTGPCAPAEYIPVVSTLTFSTAEILAAGAERAGSPSLAGDGGWRVGDRVRDDNYHGMVFVVDSVDEDGVPTFNDGEPGVSADKADWEDTVFLPRPPDPAPSPTEDSDPDAGNPEAWGAGDVVTSCRGREYTLASREGPVWITACDARLHDHYTDAYRRHRIRKAGAS